LHIDILGEDEKTHMRVTIHGSEEQIQDLVTRIVNTSVKED
jgi:hypothetical protein